MALPPIAGLYGIADAKASNGDPVSLGAQMILGGCRVVQLRCKGWESVEIERAGRELGARCRDAGVVFIMNDSVELALATGADGVHLGQLDGDVLSARERVGFVGRSTHEPEQLALAMKHADYVAFGPVFDTPNLSRPKPTRGIERLAEAARLVAGRVPLVAIGGVNAERLPEVRRLADSWAVIGAIANAADPVAATRALC